MVTMKGTVKLIDFAPPLQRDAGELPAGKPS